jgi:hypothetical protein
MDKKEALKELISIFVNGEVVGEEGSDYAYLFISESDYDRFYSLCKDFFHTHYTEIIYKYIDIWELYGVKCYYENNVKNIYFRGKYITGICYK